MHATPPTITILSTADAGAGGYIAARRLLDALLHVGAPARMLVLHKRTQHPAVQAVGAGWLHNAAHTLRLAAEVGLLLPHLKHAEDKFQFATAQQGVAVWQHPWVQDADVLHLHWINQGFLSLHGLAQLAKLRKPIVWTLHDQWAFTGGCHYSGTCTRYENTCGQCPYLRGHAQTDLSHTLLKRKAQTWQQLQPHFVTCSNWLAGLAARSKVLQGHAVQSIPNPIDTAVFCPMPKAAARQHLQLPADRKLVLFGATKLTDPRKGAMLFAQAITELAARPQAPQFDIVLFGTQAEPLPLPAGMRVHALGRVNGEAAMAQLYAAADVFVSAAVQDNLPNTVMEAQACGTPVAAFAVGGVPQLVAHQTSGYLAADCAPAQLADGLQWLLADEERLATLSRNAYLHAQQQFAFDVVARQYLALYDQLLQRAR
jgi:glycosyltransferase involved in cell wall biosynthesis